MPSDDNYAMCIHTSACCILLCVCTVMAPFGACGSSQLSSNARPCSLCSAVMLARSAGEASRVLMLTHRLATLPEGLHNINMNRDCVTGADLNELLFSLWGDDDDKLPTCPVHSFHTKTILAVRLEAEDCCFSNWTLREEGWPGCDIQRW